MRNLRFSAALVAALAVGALMISGCGGPRTAGSRGAGDSGKITVKGSDTMVILGQKWAEVYMEKNPDVTVQVTGGGSGTGFAALQNGTTDVAQASRPIKDEERDAIKSKFGKEVSEVVVAKDGVTVYVHETSPLKSITIEQLKGIYTGQIKNWNQVGGPDAPIIVYSRESNSGTYVFFKEHVLEDEDYTAQAQNMPGTAAVVNAISKDKNGIGYGGVAYAAGVKSLKVAQSAGEEAFDPTTETILSGDYPLSRDLFLYTAGEPEGALGEYIEWMLSPEGQKIVEEVEYIPVGPTE